MENDNDVDDGYEGGGKRIEFEAGESTKLDELADGASVKLTASCKVERKDDGSPCLVIESMNMVTEKPVDKELRDMTGEEGKGDAGKANDESDF